MFRIGRWALTRSVLPLSLPVPRAYPLRFFAIRDPISDLSLELTRLKTESSNDVGAITKVYMQLAKHHLRVWNLSQAKQALLSLHTILTNAPQADKTALGECLFELGEVHYNLQEAAEAKQCYESALAAFQSIVPPDNLSLAKCYYGLGNTNQFIGAFPQAMECFQSAERLSDAAGPQRDNLISLINQGYALIYRVQNKLEDAMRHAQVAVKAVSEKTERSSSQILADAYECVGDIHMAKKEVNEAVSTYKKALSLKNVLFPAKHPEIGKTMGKLGVGLVAGNNLEEAIGMFKERLEIDKAALGEVHPLVADDYHDIGFASVRLRLIDQADSAYLSELRILSSLQSPDPKRLASVHLNLLSIKLNRKEIPLALEHGHKGVEILRTMKGNKEQLAFAMSQLGEIYLQIKNLGEAKKWYQESHKTKMEIYPKDHVEVGRSLVSLGQIMGMSNDPKSAESLITQGVAILREKLKREDVSLALALAKQGTAYASNKKLEPAITSFKETVMIFRKTMPLAASSTVTSSQQLISLYMAAKMFFDAENVYRRLIADIEQAQKQSSYDFPRMVKSLYAVLQAQDKEADCAKLRAKYGSILN